MAETKNLTILGIDPGLAAGGISVVQWDETTKKFSSELCSSFTTSPKKILGHRLQKIRDYLEEAFELYRPAACFCEKPSHGSASRPYSLGCFHGMLHFMCAEYEVPLWGFAPLQLKKFCFGKSLRGYSKDMIKDFLENLEDFAVEAATLEKSDHNALDSLAAAYMGAVKMSGVTLPSRVRMELLGDLKLYWNFS